MQKTPEYRSPFLWCGLFLNKNLEFLRTDFEMSLFHARFQALSKRGRLDNVS